MLAGAGQVLDLGSLAVDALRDGAPRINIFLGGPDAGKFPFVALRRFDGLRLFWHGRLWEQAAVEVNPRYTNRRKLEWTQNDNHAIALRIART